LLTLVTCGLWALVWLYLAIFQGEKHKTLSTSDAGRPTLDEIQPWYRKPAFIFAAAILALFIVSALFGSSGQ
jgi:ABC-type Fe3+ transport system permease subunit